MSHVMELELEGFTDLTLLAAACQRIDKKLQQEYTETFFDGQKVTGPAVKLDGWKYHIVFDLTKSKVAMDNDNGRWGRIEEFDKLRQAYAVAAAINNLRKRGTSLHISEKTLPDGSIQLESIEMSGGTLHGV